MEQGILLGMLGVHAIEDLKRQGVTLPFLAIFGIAGACFQLYGQKMGALGMGSGIAVGVGLLLLSAMTAQSIGMGDGFLFCVTGVYLGGSKNLELLMMSLFYAALFALGIVLCQKRYKTQRKRRIPFVPFVFLAHATLLLEELL